MTRSAAIKLLKILSITLVLAVLGAYAVWRSLNYTKGPAIDLYEPIDGSSSASSTIVIRGKVERINSITLNGNPISIAESGDFSETVILFPGLNIETLVAYDRFGRSIEKSLRLVGEATSSKLF